MCPMYLNSVTFSIFPDHLVNLHCLHGLSCMLSYPCIFRPTFRLSLVMINRTKTVATCFSLSPKREELILQINGQEIHLQDTPTYLGVKLDRKLTWSPHIRTMHSKGLGKMALMKKLAGTKWGANMKILTQVYTATVRPHMEYASSAWSSAAKTNLDQLTKTQNAGLRIITGGMKTTPISELERTTGLLSLCERREENSCAKAKR